MYNAPMAPLFCASRMSSSTASGFRITKILPLVIVLLFVISAVIGILILVPIPPA